MYVFLLSDATMESAISYEKTVNEFFLTVKHVMRSNPPAADIMEARGEDLSGSDSDHSDFEKLDMPQPGEYVAEEYAAERARNPSGGGEKHKVRQEIG